MERHVSDSGFLPCQRKINFLQLWQSLIIVIHLKVHVYIYIQDLSFSLLYQNNSFSIEF